MEGSWDHGSKKQREELLKMSLQLMFSRPFVGIGPGNFASVSGTWHVAHNTYTELGAEAGLPALFLFVALLIRARINLKGVSRSRGLPRTWKFRSSPERCGPALPLTWWGPLLQTPSKNCSPTSWWHTRPCSI